jgi:hypothetical protein
MDRASSLTGGDQANPRDPLFSYAELDSDDVLDSSSAADPSVPRRNSVDLRDPTNGGKPMASESFELSGGADNPRTRRPPAHYKYRLPSEEEERLESLFRQLDVSKDGRVDVKDLSQSLKNMGIPHRAADAIVSNRASGSPFFVNPSTT